MDITEKEIEKKLSEFCERYRLQKGVDMDDVEFVVYEQGKKTVCYFRIKRKEIKQYGPEIEQN